MTWNEFYKLAKENYNNGGDGIVECWDERDFNEYVQEFGPMTKAAALAMFETADEVYKDMTADAQTYKDEATSGNNDDNDYVYNEIADERDSDWRPGDAPWMAPGMSIADFI